MKIQHFSISELGKFTGILGVAVFLTLSPKAKADTIDLYDFAINVNGTVTGDWQDLATTDPTTVINAGSSISNDTNCCGLPDGTAEGLGTVNYTFTGGAVGTYNVSLYYDYDVNTPYFNEYGAINNVGSAQSGVVGEIVNGSLGTNNIVLFPVCATANCEVYGTANGTNQVPGQTSNFFANCGIAFQNPAGEQSSEGPSACNSDVQMALTFTFTTTFAGQQVAISALSGTSDPGGFSLETIHPVDTNNLSASQVYLSGSYSMQSPPPPPSGVPEPGDMAYGWLRPRVVRGVPAQLA